MKIVNLTPHAIVVVSPSGETTTIPPSGSVARVATETDPTGSVVAGAPIVRAKFGPVEGLPPIEEGVWNIVSVMVRSACSHRGDLLSPGDLVRDPDGRVIGCRNLISNLEKRPPYGGLFRI